MATGERLRRQPLLLAGGLLLLFALGLLIVRAGFGVILAPAGYVQSLASLPVPVDWELAASRVEGFNLSIGPNERRYYLIDGDPEPIWNEAVAMLADAGFLVEEGWPTECRRNGIDGPMTCNVVADREAVQVWISVNERGSVTDVQDDPEGREVGRLGFSLLVMQASAARP